MHIEKHQQMFTIDQDTSIGKIIRSENILFKLKPIYYDERYYIQKTKNKTG